MIILAVVSVNVVLGENGIIRQAEKTKMMQSHASVEEAIKLAYVDYQFEQMTGETAKIEETKLASVETGIKLAANDETFLDYLIRKGYANTNGVVNVENLLGNNIGVGNGSGDSDVYKIEESEEGYDLNYYGKDGEKTELTVIETSTTIEDGVITAPEEYAYSFQAGDDITAYVVDNGDETYDMIFVGTGEMYYMFLWQCPDIFNTFGMCGGTFSESYKITIKNVKISDGVTNISNEAFKECSGLTSITIPSSVTSISDYAFDGCSGLTSITIPSSVTSIGDYAFDGCSGLTSIEVDENNPAYDSRNNCNAIINTANNEIIIGCKNTVIPDSVTSIGDNVFYECSSLTSITIPSSVTSIGNGAFFTCNSLTTVNYRGTQEQWNAITIDYNNDSLINATINYNYTGE